MAIRDMGLPLPATPGRFLKTVRERLQVGLREVQEASTVIAGEEGLSLIHI